jgi:Zn-dependent protease
MSEDPWGLPPATLEPPPEPEYQGPVQTERSLLRRVGGSIVAAALAVVKFGGLILTGLFKFKFALSFLITAGVYALFFGWQFGIGLVLLLLVHEMGHVIQLRREGLSASAPMFIPFMGAMVAMRDMPKDAWTEAKVGLAGPVLGSAGALAVLIWAEEVDSNLLRALAYVGFLLNLFNLVPVVPLDGGRAVAALHPVFWFVGLFMVALLAFHYRNPFFFIVLVFVAFEVYRRWQGRNHPAARAYHDVSWGRRAIVFSVYIGLVVALVVGMHFAFVTVN